MDLMKRFMSRVSSASHIPVIKNKNLSLYSFFFKKAKFPGSNEAVHELHGKNVYALSRRPYQDPNPTDLETH